MKCVVYDDDGSEAFSIHAPPDLTSQCLAPGLAERPKVIQALRDSLAFLGSPPSSQQFTPDEKQREARRELAYRRHVFERLVESQKMQPDIAARRIALMEEIAADYAELAKTLMLL